MIHYRVLYITLQQMWKCGETGGTELNSIVVELTFEEAEFIADVLGYWEQGLSPASDDTIADASIGSAEELLTLTAGYDEQRRLVNEIREKIRTK